MRDQDFQIISRIIQTAVDDGSIPGAVFRLSRKGEVLYHEAFGWQDSVEQIAMQRDSLFRLKSMTKLVTAIATLSAIEQGVLSLMDPLEKFIPAFHGPEILLDPVLGGETAKCHTPITIYHLLTHTSGLCYGQGGQAIRQLYDDAGLYFNIFFRSPMTTAEVVERLATLPLLFRPGSNWAYSWGCDVLGRVLEVIDGKSLEQVFRDRVFTPLGLSDIGFSIGLEKSDRMAQPLREDRVQYFGADGGVDNTPFYSGGEGLVASASDWGKLVEMMLQLPRQNAVLSPATIRYMLSDHVGSFADGGYFNLQNALTYGIGGYLKTRDGLSTSPSNIGEFGWWGSWGTSFWGDPEEDLAGVLLMQKSDEARYYTETIKFQVYNALSHP